MPAAKLPDADFLSEFRALGAHKMARKHGISVTAIYGRRARLEAKHGQIQGPPRHNTTRHAEPIPARLHLAVKDGVVLAGSDAHFWPGIITTAHRAFCHLARELQPKAIILNGDALDGAKISRHPPMEGENAPDLVAELEACQARMAEIERAAPNAKRFWPRGNHDGRYETRLATVAPEYAAIKGFSLRDHFPYWRRSWSVWINDDVVVKHRWRSGMHAPHNNTVGSGKTMVTGHLHSLRVSPYDDYNPRTRFGVDCGTLADTYGPQFAYMEDNPRNWRSGFAVLTFHKGRLLWPELVHVIAPGQVEFRGRVIEVSDGPKTRKR